MFLFGFNRAALWEWIDVPFDKTMDTRFLAFVVALICIFASNNSEGKRKLADNGVHWDALLIDKDKVFQIANLGLFDVINLVNFTG